MKNTVPEMIEVLEASQRGQPIEYRNNYSETAVWMRIRPHLISGYCFPRDIHPVGYCGMIKVMQVSLGCGENPL